MRGQWAVLLLAALPAALPAAAHLPLHAESAAMKKLTPVLVVDRVEPCAEFWTGRLGFARTTEVPHGDELGFVILQKDGVEIMYQSRASVAADLPALAEGPHRTVLYVEVDDLDAVERAVQGAEVVQPRRTTFYGMQEIAVREPGGNVVVFAQPTGGS
ncbi:MAG TPA: VOC family protein [Longimicrobiaceae bacterium]|nr:VOC family protein [Longimicrobiaceae bacterium]